MRHHNQSDNAWGYTYFFSYILFEKEEIDTLFLFQFFARNGMVWEKRKSVT